MGWFSRKKNTTDNASKQGVKKKVVKGAHFLTVEQIKSETPTSASILLNVPTDLQANFQFKAGQYLTFIVEINGEEVRRSYSICSGESEKGLRVGVKRVSNGKMSNYLLDSVQSGDELLVMEPAGNFALEDGGSNYVAFAAGSGITPILSQLKKVAKSDGSFQLFFGNKTETETMFKQEIDALISNKIGVQYSYTQSGDARFTKDRVLELFRANLELLKADGFYLCGPEEMIQAVCDALFELGVNKEKVHFELFTASTKEQTNQQKEVNETFSGKAEAVVLLDGESVSLHLNAKGDTILDHLLDLGYDAPYSCKGAVCSTCRAKVTEGKATMMANYSLSDKEVEEGYILTCQAHPCTSKITVDFDQG